MTAILFPADARRAERVATTRELRFHHRKSRFPLDDEPKGERATVVLINVVRPILENTDDELTLELVVDERHVSFAWEGTVDFRLDLMRRGDTVWLDEDWPGVPGVDGPPTIRLTTRPGVWQHSLRVERWGDRLFVAARPEHACPLEVRLKTSVGYDRPVAKFEVANDALVLVPFVPSVGLDELKVMLSSHHRTLSLPLWGALCVELASFEAQYGAVEDPGASLRWTLTGAWVEPRARGPRDTEAEAVKRWCAQFPLLLDGVNGPVRARTGGAAVPAGLPVEKADATRALIKRMGHCDFGSRCAVLEAMAALVTPAPRDQLIGIAFSVCPDVLEAIDWLLAHPAVVPAAWDGVVPRGAKVIDALAVLADGWRAVGLEVDGLPATQSPTVRLAPPRPMSVKNARRADAIDDEPEEPAALTALKDLLSKLPVERTAFQELLSKLPLSKLPVERTKPAVEALKGLWSKLRR